MKKLLPLLLVVALLGGCAPVAPAPSPAPSPTVSATPAPAPAPFSLSYDPAGSWNPITGESRTNLLLAPLLYEGLFSVDNHFAATPLLCGSQSVSEDGLTWTFTLAHAEFSPGVPVAATDAVRSLNLARESTQYAARLAALSSVKAVEGALVVTLKTPNAALPLLLDVPIIQAVEGDGAPGGTGAYTLEPTTNGFRLARKPTAANTLPAAIPLVPITTADDLIYAFDAGDISLVTADLTGANALGYAGNYEVWEYPTTSMLYVGFHAAKGPCKDPALRSALTLGFDRVTIAGSLLSGHAVAAALPVHPAANRPGASPAASDYSLPGLAERLDALGYLKNDAGVRAKNRVPLKLKLAVNNENGFKLNVADYLAECLGREGVEIVLQKLSWDDYTAALQKGNFDLYLGEVRMTPDFDPTPLIAANGALNYGGYPSGALTDLLAAARETGAWSDFYEAFPLETPFAVLTFKSSSVLTRWGRIHDATPTAGNLFYDFANWAVR